MGFEKGRAGHYFRVSCGKFVGKINGEEREEIAYTGYLREIRFYIDKYEEKEIPKYEVTFAEADGTETVRFQFIADGWYSVGFFSRIQKIDLKQKFTLGIMGSDDHPESKVSFCWMKQNGEKIVKDDAFPKPEKISTGRNQTSTNWTKVQEAIDPILASLQVQLGMDKASEPFAPLPEPAPAKDGFSKPPEKDPSDDLPF